MNKYETAIVRSLRYNDLESAQDGYELCKALELDNSTEVDYMPEFDKDNFKLAHSYIKQVRKKALMFAKKGLQEGADLYYRCLLFDAPYEFDAYLRAIEHKQEPDKRFYTPRRKYLKPVVDAYQEVLDCKIGLLTVSMTKRAGKSQLGINFVDMISGKYPNRSTLMEGTGDALVDSFYKGCLEYLDRESDYGYYDIFPDAKLVQTNADTKIFNLNEKNRFPTVMCRSIDARQVGLSEATNVLYLDDCVEGAEEAKNRARLDNKWEVISGDVIGRAVEGTPIVICGTRYSVYDPIGRLIEEAQKQGWNYKTIEIPALDENDKSNYEYYNPKVKGKVFTTEFFLRQRDMLTEEQWSSEFQQQPFESKGVLFPESRLNRYFELPVDKSPDAIIAVCDTAEGKGDSTMMPVAYIYGDDVFIHDCVFSNATPEFTKPECAKKIVENGVSSITFESNAAGQYFCRDVEKLVKELGGRCSFKSKFSVTNKNTRIEFASANILKHFYFKDKSLYSPSSEYGRMIKELVQYTRTGKVKHDDSPDGLSLLENELRGTLNSVDAIVVKRPSYL